ncbi:MAG: hypothetical protein NZ847_01355, partial [Acidobacteria bacterium]|nr:hypothetical protein [Acidobacteriota bacterium]
MCAGGEHTKGLDTGKGLVRTFMYMNNTTTPNMSFHHLTSIFATTAGRLVVPMRSLVTKFLAVTAIFLVASTALVPSAFASSSDGAGALLVNGAAEDINLEMVVSSEATFEIVLATDPGAGTPAVVDLTLGTGKGGDPADVFFILDKSQLTFTGGLGGDWDTPRTVIVATTAKHGWKDFPVTIKVTSNGNDSNSVNVVVIHVHDDDGGAGEGALLVNGDTKKLKLEIVPGSGDNFEVELATDPGAGKQVVVDVTSKKTDQVTVDHTQLTFTGGSDGNWDTPRT